MFLKRKIKNKLAVVKGKLIHLEQTISEGIYTNKLTVEYLNESLLIKKTERNLLESLLEK